MQQIQQTDPVTTIELAPPTAKHALAKGAWDALPLERRTSDNLTALSETVASNPAAFMAMCQHYNLPVDLSIVVNHHETHNHYHQQPPQNQVQPGLTASEVAEIVRANQQQGLSATDVLALVQSVQSQQQLVVQQGYTQQEMIDAITYATAQQPIYYAPPEPAYFDPAPQIVFEPHIEVHAGGGHSYSRSDATSHSEQDNRGGAPLVVAVLAVLLMLFGVGVGANQ